MTQLPICGLSSPLSHGKTQETLVLEGLPATEMMALANALPRYKKLKHLTLRNFKCGQDEAKLFGEAGLASHEKV